MPRLTEHCPATGCGKILETVAIYDIGPEKFTQYKCGHCFASTHIHTPDDDIITTGITEGYKLRPYQLDGVKFILASDCNCVIGDQMRLGKTPQALMALRNQYTERTPCLIIVRSANIWQWTREYRTWVDPNIMGIWPILGTTGLIPPGFKTYIISMDTLGRPGTCKNCTHSLSRHDEKTNKCSVKKCKCNKPESNNDSILDRLREIDFKLIIADEAHSFKNDDSQRSRAVVQFLTEKNTLENTRTLYYSCPYCQHTWERQIRYTIINGAEQYVSDSTTCPSCHASVGVRRRSEPITDRKCGCILLTGTAIKNAADEYFIPLNLVAPQKFSSRARFEREWLQPNDKGRYTRIKSYRYEEFKKYISPYVLRREKEDVYTDLPPLNRMFTLIEPDKGALSTQYNKILDKIDAQLASRANPSYWELATEMMELRKICGLMKVMWTADYVEASLMDSEKDNNGKIAIGIHHHDVRDILKFKLQNVGNGVLSLSGEDSSEQKDYIMHHFATSPEKILVINMLAGGVGMDFHYCHNVIILERQWSFADEEQFEFRFYNPDKSIQGDAATQVEYIVAKGTLDEWWYNMIEAKKQIQGETIGTNWDLSQEPDSFRRLLEETVSNRL